MAEGIIGVKKSDYVTPERAIGVDPDDKSIPEDIKFFIKQGLTMPGGIRKRVELYEVIEAEEKMKYRLEHVETYDDRLPERDEIGLNFGPAKIGYKWIAKWIAPNGERVNMESEVILISEKWRDRYEAHKKMKQAEADAKAAAVSAPAPAAGVSGQFGPMEMFAFIREGEERSIKMMERMSLVLKSTEGPSEVFVKAYDAVGKFLEKSMESNMMIARKVADNAKAMMDPPEVEEDEEEEEEVGQAASGPSDGIPAWLAPFMPKIQDGLAHLLGGGPVGAAVKTLIVTSDDWKKIFADKEKFAEATEAMKIQFGEDKTKRALDILLNVRPDKTKKKGK